jgi:hypothetical protein
MGVLSAMTTTRVGWWPWGAHPTHPACARHRRCTPLPHAYVPTYPSIMYPPTEVITYTRPGRSAPASALSGLHTVP